MLMGLRSEPWFGTLEEELIEKIPEEGISRNDLFSDYPKGKENAHIQRSLKSALSNMERQLVVAKQFVDVPNRKRSMAIFKLSLIHI